MPQRLLATACLLGLMTAPLWAEDLSKLTEGDWDSRLLSTAIYDNRTDLEKLQDQVTDLSKALAAAQQQITGLQSQLDAQADVLLGQELDLQTLTGVIQVEDGKVTINGTTVEINASSLTVNADASSFSGSVTCDSLTTESVDSKSYTPGAGNIW